MDFKPTFDLKTFGCVALGIACAVSAFCVKQLYYGDVYDNIDTANRLLGYFCDQDNPVYNTRDYAWAATLRENWHVIRDEYELYATSQTIPFFRDINHNNSLWGDASDWRTLILRTFCLETRVCSHFPRTLALIDQLDLSSEVVEKREHSETVSTVSSSSVIKTLAMFSILEPGTKLPPHNGIYRGVLRYHLGLSCPTDDKGECYLEVFDSTETLKFKSGVQSEEKKKGTKLRWSNGQDLMFDDCYLHRAANKTTERRLVLILDVRREFGRFWLDWFNRVFLRYLANQSENHETRNLVNRWVT